MKEKKGINKGVAMMLRLLQHICMACFCVAFLMVCIASNVGIKGMHGTTHYDLYSMDSGNAMKDTVLVNTILGKDVADILRYGAIASQIETDGKYDPKKIIDVVGFNYRDADLPKNYTTATYYLEDLLKWGKYGVATDPFDNRYLTADGKKIEDIVETDAEYESMVRHVKQAAEDLYSNYTEYLSFQDYYGAENSNLRYGIAWGENQGCFTNVEEIKANEVSLERYFHEMPMYLQYHPAKIAYETNTAIGEKTFRNLQMKYSYAYPEDTEFWIGVSLDDLQNAQDEFAQAELVYNHLYQQKDMAAYVAIATALIYLVILCFLTITEGKTADKSKRKQALTRFDEISTEAFLVLCILFVAALGVCIALFSDLYATRATSYFLRSYDIYILFAVGGFVFDLFALCLYYSLVRRIKSGALWRRSYLVKGICLCLKKVICVGKNAPLAVRIMLPFWLVVLLNLVMGCFGTPFMILVILLDLCICAYLFEEALKRQDIVEGIRKISEGDFTYRANLSKLHGENKSLGEAVNSIGDGIKVAVEKSMKDERMKSELITNVSHDIKTPLTSIINYVDLLKRERLENEKVSGYIQVLDEKSQRLKQLTDDLVEASKISSGNIVLNLEKINLIELINQSVAEFSDKFEEKGLQVRMNNKTENPYVCADSRRIWRVMENLFINIYKYSLEQTRVYIELGNSEDMQKVIISMKNISASSLNCDPAELTERFMRGDESRTTEGSGLGLSIARNLVEIQRGNFEVFLDGDLFKVVMTFPVFSEENTPGIVTVEMNEG